MIFYTFQPQTAAMVDMDKNACCQLTENGYRNGQWPESYITWEFLADHPRAMESGYFHVDWNSIPRLYNRKSYLRTLVIEKKEWDHLSNPAQLKHYWEPTQESDDFHQTLGLALCWIPFHDCSEPGRKKEYIVLVAVLLKLARHFGLPFTAAAAELQDDAELTPTLLLVRLHRKFISLISPLCTTQGRGTMWETHKSSSEPFSKMLSPLGKIHPQRQNFCRRI